MSSDAGHCGRSNVSDGESWQEVIQVRSKLSNGDYICRRMYIDY